MAGRLNRDAGKPLQVKDKYITIVFKGYFFLDQQK